MSFLIISYHFCSFLFNLQHFSLLFVLEQGFDLRVKIVNFLLGDVIVFNYRKELIQHFYGVMGRSAVFVRVVAGFGVSQRLVYDIFKILFYNPLEHTRSPDYTS